jgi:hypothetical protein
LSPDETDDLVPATVKFDNSCQLAFEIERIAGGNMSVFLPDSPDPRFSPVRVATDDRLTPLGMTVKATADVTKRLGRGRPTFCRILLHLMNPTLRRRQ